MNGTRTFITALAVVVGLSACSAQQRQVVENVLADDAPTEATVAASEPTVTASVDCHDFYFTVSGYSEGTSVFVAVGSQPPWGFTVGGNYWNFTPIDGGATGHILIPEYEAGHSFNAIIDTDDGTTTSRPFDQFVDCATP